MTRWTSACLVLLSAAVFAQPALPVELDAVAAYARIDDERARETARLHTEEAACYQHFAVNRCLQGVKRQRTAMLNRLRSQEAALNDAERQKQGVEQRQRIADKQAQRVEQDASREPAQRPAGAEPSPKLPAVPALPSAVAPGGTPEQQRKVTGPSPQEQASNREAHARKLAAAEEKRQAVVKKQADKTGNPLPLPAARP